MEEMRAKQDWKPGNMLYPLPAVMVSVAGESEDKPANIITVAWAGTVCTNPAMLSISVRPERYSYELLRKHGEFVVNLTTKDLVKACDFCGVRSGRDVDKFKECGLTESRLSHCGAPAILESPVNIGCKVREVLELGSHHMFLADITGVTIDEAYLNETGKFELNESDLVTYSHGEYFLLGEKLGSFGYSVKKEKTKKKKK